MPRIPGDLLSVPIPAITNLVNAPIVSYCNVRRPDNSSSQQNQSATGYLIGYTALGYNDTPYGVT